MGRIGYAKVKKESIGPVNPLENSVKFNLRLGIISKNYKRLET